MMNDTLISLDSRALNMSNALEAMLSLGGSTVKSKTPCKP